MLKDEWLEYFEAVNGRKPRPIDFKEKRTIPHL